MLTFRVCSLRLYSSHTWTFDWFLFLFNHFCLSPSPWAHHRSSVDFHSNTRRHKYEKTDTHSCLIALLPLCFSAVSFFTSFFFHPPFSTPCHLINQFPFDCQSFTFFSALHFIRNFSAVYLPSKKQHDRWTGSCLNCSKQRPFTTTYFREMGPLDVQSAGSQLV